MTTSLHSMGYLFGLAGSRVEAIAQAAGVSLIAAAVVAAIILLLCAGDGPFLIFTCGFGWLLGGAVVERVSNAARSVVAAGGC